MRWDVKNTGKDEEEWQWLHTYIVLVTNMLREFHLNSTEEGPYIIGFDLVVRSVVWPHQILVCSVLAQVQG